MYSIKTTPQQEKLLTKRKGINYSANVATVYASLLKGVLVEESLEKRIKQSGLKKLKDARNESPESCFKRCKNNLIEVQLLASTQK